MAYYKKRKKRKNKNVINDYCPPKTYKNRQPTKEEFDVQDIDVDKIEKEYKLYEKRMESISLILTCLWFFLGFIPSYCLSLLIYNYTSINETLMHVLTIVFYFLLLGLFPNLQNIIKYRKIKDYEKVRKYKYAISEYEWWQLRKKKDFWYRLSGRQFEIEISSIFKKQGYKTKVCKQGGDEGVDVEIEKNGVIEIIQCKNHKSKVSPSVARDLLGTMVSKNVSHSYLITLNGGTSGTLDFCNKNNITLWDVDDIIKYAEDDL